MKLKRISRTMKPRKKDRASKRWRKTDREWPCETCEKCQKSTKLNFIIAQTTRMKWRKNTVPKWLEHIERPHSRRGRVECAILYVSNILSLVLFVTPFITRSNACSFVTPLQIYSRFFRVAESKAKWSSMERPRVCVFVALKPTTIRLNIKVNLQLVCRSVRFRFVLQAEDNKSKSINVYGVWCGTNFTIFDARYINRLERRFVCTEMPLPKRNTAQTQSQHYLNVNQISKRQRNSSGCMKFLKPIT